MFESEKKIKDIIKNKLTQDAIRELYGHDIISNGGEEYHILKLRTGCKFVIPKSYINMLLLNDDIERIISKCI